MARKIQLKRLGFYIDMTPLVDIMMLLLVFFLFTATFKTAAEAEQQFHIERPATTPVDTADLPEINLATILIAVDTVTMDTSYYYTILNEHDRNVVWENTPGVPEEVYASALIHVADLETLNDLVRNTRITNPTTTFAIDADKRLRFEWVNDAMDILRKNRATFFSYVVDKQGQLE